MRLPLSQASTFFFGHFRPFHLLVELAFRYLPLFTLCPLLAPGLLYSSFGFFPPFYPYLPLFFETAFPFPEWEAFILYSQPVLLFPVVPP